MGAAVDWIELVKGVAQLGSMGLLVFYLIYTDQQRAKQRTLDKAAQVAAEKEAALARVEVDKETNEERRALTSALVLLRAVIEARGHV